MTSSLQTETSLYVWEIVFNGNAPDMLVVRCAERPSFLDAFYATGRLPEWVVLKTVTGDTSAIRESAINAVEECRVEAVNFDWVQQADEDEWPEDVDPEGFPLVEAEPLKPVKIKRKPSS